MSRINIIATLGLCLLSAIVSAQSPLPYVTSFDTPTEQADWQLFRLEASGTGTVTWRFTKSASFSGAYGLEHDYPVGVGTLLIDDWLVSPEFNFADGATIDSIRRNFTGLGVPDGGDTIALYLLKGDRDPSKGERVLLYDYRDTAYSSDNTWYKTRPIGIPASTGKSYLAFRYRATSGWLYVRFDNLSLSRKVPADIGLAQPAPQLIYYPNPARDVVEVVGPVQQLSLYDLAGRLLVQQSDVRLDLRHLPAGTYILQALQPGGNIVYGRVVKP